jgi:hypothetical protein
MEAGVHVLHEFVEMDAPLACDGDAVEEHVHEHALAAADLPKM